MSATPIKTFICYAHEDREIVKNVLKYLQPLKKQKLLEIWDDGQILAGEDWDKVIKTHLDTAKLVLLFVSIDFINSDYIESTEIKLALERHDSGESVIVPIIVKNCDWQDYFKIGRFKALPKQNRPILSKHFQLVEEAYHEIELEVKALAKQLASKRSDVVEPEQMSQLGLPLEKKKENSANQLTDDVSAQVKNQETEENARLDQLLKQDECAWQIASEQAKQTVNAKEKIDAFVKYMDNPEHRLYRIVAEHLIEHLNSIVIIETQSAEPARLQELKAIESPIMISLIGGTFQMGNVMEDILVTEDYDETVHTVTINDFYLSKHAVSFEEFDQFCEETDREKPNDAGWGRGKYPVINVDWYDAVEFCNWLSNKVGLEPCYEIDQKIKDRTNLSAADQRSWHVRCDWDMPGYRLPSESEWEYAARSFMHQPYWSNGGGKIRFGSGRELCDPSEVNFDASSKLKVFHSIVGEFRAQTVKVDALSSNGLGFKNMSGNVFEWCWDWYGKGHYPERDQARNPHGPASGVKRVIRGGSWRSLAIDCRTSSRSSQVASWRMSSLGFRIAKNA